MSVAIATNVIIPRIYTAVPVYIGWPIKTPRMSRPGVYWVVVDHIYQFYRSSV